MITDKDKAAIEAHYADEKGLFEVPSKFKGDVALVRKYEDEIEALKAKIDKANAVLGKCMLDPNDNLGQKPRLFIHSLLAGISEAMNELTQ